MIEVKNLSFRYRLNAPLVLNDLNFSVPDGTVLSILGKNGVGKTTFLRCLTAERRDYTGEILFDQREVRSFSTSELSKKLALVASNNPCYQNLKVADYLVTGFANQLASLQTPSRKQYEQAAEALSHMGQTALFNRCIFELSSGEMQLVKIARAMLQNPSVIIFDEPTSNLDIKNQLLVLEQITALSAKGYTVITTTHNPGQTIELGGMVLMLSGTLQFFGKTEDMLSVDNLQAIYDLTATVGTKDGRQYTVFENTEGTHKLFF